MRLQARRSVSIKILCSPAEEQRGFSVDKDAKGGRQRGLRLRSKSIKVGSCSRGDSLVLGTMFKNVTVARCQDQLMGYVLRCESRGATSDWLPQKQTLTHRSLRNNT